MFEFSTPESLLEIEFSKPFYALSTASSCTGEAGREALRTTDRGSIEICYPRAAK